jgi:hypothetical protein
MENGDVGGAKKIQGAGGNGRVVPPSEPLNIKHHYGPLLVVLMVTPTKWKKKYYAKFRRRAYWMGLI